MQRISSRSQWSNFSILTILSFLLISMPVLALAKTGLVAVTNGPNGTCGGCPSGQSCTANTCAAITCTSFTYSAWGSCISNNQTRTVVTSSPTGCTGGSPSLSQGCTSPGSVSNGGICSQNVDCSSGNCYNGYCSGLGAPGNPCSYGSDCSSGVCGGDGYCA